MTEEQKRRKKEIAEIVPLLEQFNPSVQFWEKDFNKQRKEKDFSIKQTVFELEQRKGSWILQ